MDDVLADLEKVCRMISSETFTSATSSAITSLSFHMKMMGHQLEGICKGIAAAAPGPDRPLVSCRGRELEPALRAEIIFVEIVTSC